MKKKYYLSSDNPLKQYLNEKKDAQKKSYIPKNIVCYPNHLKHKKNPKILLIFPPITIPNGMMKRCIPPLGLCYIASNLLKNDYNVSILDAVVEGHDCHRYSEKKQLLTYGLSLDDILERIKSESPDIIGISVVFSTDLKNLYDVARLIKTWNSDITVVCGGLHPSIYPREIFEETTFDNLKLIDFIIRGEGEYRFIDFLNNYKKQKIDLNADGLCGWYDDKLFFNPQISRIKNLDSLPFPSYDLLPIEKYFKINIPFSPVPKGKRVLPILNSRGCPIGCNFCANTNMYKQFFARSPENIIEEISLLKEKYQVDEIQFADDNLTLKKTRAKVFFNKLKELDIMWCTPNGVMINTIDDEMINLMAQSGMYQITFSIDSGCAKTLKHFHEKPLNLNLVKALVNKANELEIFSHGTLVVGMPGETLSEIIEGLDFVYNLDLTSLSVFIASPIPGSVLYHFALEKGLINKNEARRINTTKSSMKIPGINSKELENLVIEFQEKYAKKIEKNNPRLLKRKYKMHISRDPSILKKINFRLT